MYDFLFSAVMTAALIGIPTLIHWMWRGRKGSLDASYNWTLGHLLVWFGTIYTAVATIIFVLASADLLFGARHEYPAWSLLFSSAMIAVGLIVRRAGKLWLAHQRRTSA